MKFIATKRELQGKGASRRLRRASKVPGIVYGGNQPAVAVEMDHNEMFYNLRKEQFHSCVLTMEIDGKEEQVLLRDFQVHPYKPQVMHMDFQRVVAEEMVETLVPLHYHGQENSPAVKLNKALISRVHKELLVRCLPKDLPEFIDVDLSGLQAGHTFRVSDLTLPAGVTAVNKPTEALVAVLKTGGGSAAAAG